MKGKFTVRHAMLLKLIVAVAVIAGFAGVAEAFINPNFSPVHLLEQSDQVFVVKFEGAPKDGKVKAAIVKVLKGEKPKKAPTFDFFAGAHEAQGQLIVRTIAGGTTEAMLFVGFFEDEEGGGDPMGDEEAAKAFLHIAGQWVVLAGFEPDLWDMVKIESRMLGTWAGSTDMLLRVINYVLSDEDAEVPLQSNAEWAKHVKVGNVQGKVRAARPVFLSPDAAPVLFIASEAGDRLYECKGGVFADVTAQAGPRQLRRQETHPARADRWRLQDAAAGHGRRPGGRMHVACVRHEGGRGTRRLRGHARRARGDHDQAGRQDPSQEGPRVRRRHGSRRTVSGRRLHRRRPPRCAATFCRRITPL